MYVWDTPIDVDTDLTDVTLWNTLLAATHERLKTSTITTSFGSYLVGIAYASLENEAQILPFRPDKHNPSLDGDFLKSGILFGAGSPSKYWRYYSLWEMQYAIYIMVDSAPGSLQFWNHIDYPDLTALTYGTLSGLNPPRIVNKELLCERLGYPDNSFPTSGTIHFNFWRRKAPRVITSLTQQYPKVFNEFGAIVTVPEEFDVGDRAQYISTGNKYRGIYEYAGGSTWVRPADRSAGADILDSNNEHLTKDWTTRGFFRPGDYFGYWNLEEIRLALKSLLVQFQFPSITYRNYAGGHADFEPPPDPLDKAEALAELEANIAADFVDNEHPPIDAMVGSFWEEDGSTWSGGENAQIRTTKATASRIMYQNIDREIELYGRFTVPSWNDSTGNLVKDGGALGNDLKLLHSDTKLATSHSWSNDSFVYLNAPIPNFYDPVEYDVYNMDVETMIVKYDYQYK